MNNIYSLLKLFGERYIYCDDEQAEFDVKHNREDLISSFNAILNCVELLKRDD